MSYSAETAMKPLTGEPFDECILNEREQKHLICLGECAGMHAMPSREYCELRDMYIAMVNGKKKGQKPLTLEEAIELSITEPCVFWEFYNPGSIIGSVKLIEHPHGGFIRAYCPGGVNDIDPLKYGKEWRCWKDKPTDAERAAAKWEE